jgi:hypothetical protein
MNHPEAATAWFSVAQLNQRHTMTPHRRVPIPNALRSRSAERSGNGGGSASKSKKSAKHKGSSGSGSDSGTGGDGGASALSERQRAQVRNAAAVTEQLHRLALVAADRATTANANAFSPTRARTTEEQNEAYSVYRCGAFRCIPSRLLGLTFSHTYIHSQ